MIDEKRSKAGVQIEENNCGKNVPRRFVTADCAYRLRNTPNIKLEIIYHVHVQYDLCESLSAGGRTSQRQSTFAERGVRT